MITATEPVVFQLKVEHVKLLRQANVVWDNTEFGAPAIDGKRPFGNSDVYTDIAEILEIQPALVKDGEDIFSTEQEQTMFALYRELNPALQVILCTGKFEPGTYVYDKYMNNWRLM